MELALLTGKTAKWLATRELGPDEELGLGVAVCSPDLSRRGIRKLQDALEATESGLRLFQHLKEGPDFEFARFGIDSALNPSLAYLSNYLQTSRKPNGGVWTNLHCIVRERLYEQLGRPRDMLQEFRPGYRWNMYSGEHYLPLHSQDQGELNDICQNLFPELIGGTGWSDI